MKHYSMNFFKGSYFCLGEAVLLALVAGFIALIEINDDLVTGSWFIGTFLCVWIIRYCRVWKKIDVDDMQITVHRFLRKPLRFSIKDNLVAFQYEQHTMATIQTHVSPYIRIIDKDSHIIEIRCPYFTKKVMDEVCGEVRKRQFT